MKPLPLSIFILIFGCSLLPQIASAQPESRDHRKPIKKTPEAAHRRNAKDHRAPKTKDHRALKTKDHRAPKTTAPVPDVTRVRDHRDGDKKNRDHRKPTAGHSTDHLGQKHPAKGQPGGFESDTSARRNEVVSARRKRPRSWRNYEMPVVNRYWPSKGAVGTSVTIHGANFEPGLAVFLGDKAIAVAATTDTTVTFTIPEGAGNGLITMRNKRRTLAIGAFEIAAEYDARAERKKLRAEQRKAAEATWKHRKKSIGKNREERLAKLRERENALEASRDERRTTRHAEIRAQFKVPFLADADTMVELSLHAERLARLQRMERLAEANADGKLMVRINIAIADEDTRHAARVATLKSSFQSR